MSQMQPGPINLGLGVDRFRAWRELALLGMIVMELSIIIPWFRSLTPETLEIKPAQAMLFLGLVMGFSLVVARLMNFFRLKLSVQRVIFLCYIILSSLFGLRFLLYETERIRFLDLIYRPVQAFTDWRIFIPPELIIALTIFFTTWRGIALAQKYIEPVSVRRDFLVGVMAMILFAFVNTSVTGETPGNFIYIFLAAGLLSMSSARIYSISQLRGGTKNPFDLRWFFGLSLAISFVILASTSITWMMAQQLAIVQGIGGLVMGFFALILLGISSPLIFFAQWLSDNSPGLSSSIARLLESLRLFREAIHGFSQRIFTPDHLSGIFSLFSILKPIVLWAFIGLALTFLLMGIRRWKLRERAILIEDGETTVLGIEFLNIIRDALNSAFQRVKVLSDKDGGRRSGRRWLAAARIRRIYWQLLNLAADLGIPKSKSQTPLEYLPELIALFPQFQEQLILITQAYLDVRYGELAESEEEIGEVERAWHVIELAGRLMEKRISQRRGNLPISSG